MCCSTSTIYAMLITPEMDLDDVRFGQLLVLAAGLAFVLLGNIAYVLISLSIA